MTESLIFRIRIDQNQKIGERAQAQSKYGSHCCSILSDRSAVPTAKLDKGSANKAPDEEKGGWRSKLIIQKKTPNMGV